MNIQSDGSSITLKVVRKLISIVNIATMIVMGCYVLAMSYGHVPADPLHVMFLGIIRFVISNIYYTLASKKSLQLFEQKPFATLLSNHMLFGPISIFVDLAMIWTLVTGNMVGWGWYLITVVCIHVSGAIHKKQKGVKIKDWTK